MRTLGFLLARFLAVTSCEARNKIRNLSPQEKIRELVVGGTTVVGSEFDFVARFENGTRYCGGALIDQSHVVTSASCLASVFRNGKPTNVRVGALDDLTESNLFNIDCVTINPVYSNTGPFPIADIAVVKLKRSSSIAPLALNRQTNFPQTDATLKFLGFGSKAANSTTPSPTLQEATLRSVSFAACQNIFKSLTSGQHICAGGVRGVGGCISDGGGPLIDVNPIQSTEELLLAGIYSFDSRSCGNSTPDVFVPIATFASWIDSTTRQSCPSATTPRPTSASTPAPTPLPTTQTPAPTQAPASSCFSGEATLDVLGKGQVAMKDLSVGDQVFAGYQNHGYLGGNKPVYEMVYGFGHRNEETTAEYLRITTNIRGKRPLEISGSHLIFIQGQEDPVRADSLQVGEQLLHQSLHQGITTPARITNIDVVRQTGLYQPLTKDGTILVDGILSSTYVSIVEIAPRAIEFGLHVFSEQSGFHLWMAPYRLVCTKVSPQLCINDYSSGEEGITHWLALGKSLVQFGEKLPSGLLSIYIALIASVCGAIMFLDSLLEGDAGAVSALLCTFGLVCLWPKAKVA